MKNQKLFQLNNPFAVVHLKTDGSFDAISCPKRDITLGFIYKYVQSPLSFVHANYFSVFHNISDCMLIVDDDGRMRDNPKLNKLASYIYGSVIVGDVLLGTLYNPCSAEPDVCAFDINHLTEIWFILRNLDDFLKKVDFADV